MSTGDRLNDAAALAIGHATLNATRATFATIEPPSENARTAALLDIAMTVLRQIAVTPRNRKARINASAAVQFIQSQMEA